MPELCKIFYQYSTSIISTPIIGRYDKYVGNLKGLGSYQDLVTRGSYRCGVILNLFASIIFDVTYLIPLYNHTLQCALIDGWRMDIGAHFRSSATTSLFCIYYANL